MFSVVVGLITTYVHNSLRSYLICSKREEFLRFNLEDFWSPDPYDGSSFTKFPLYHPFKILSWILCKYWKIPWKQNKKRKNILVYAHFILVPLSYLKIAMFLRHQNQRIGGNDLIYCILCNSYRFDDI